MKKSLLLFLLTLPLFATEPTGEIRIAAGQVRLNDSAVPMYTLGFGTTRYTEDNFIVGFSMDINYARVKLPTKNSSMIGYNFDGKLGYAFLDNDLGIYSLISFSRHNIGSSDSYGAGLGAGVDYRLTKKISFAIEYKNYNVFTGSYWRNDDYETVLGVLKVSF